MRGLEADFESSTLLEQPPDHLTTPASYDGARHDRPILVSDFLRHARRLKAVLVVLLIGCYVLNAAVLIQLRQASNDTHILHEWRLACEGVSLAIKTLILALLCTNVYDPSVDFGIWVKAHSRFCVSTFCLLLIAVLTEALPWASFVFRHHYSPQSEGIVLTASRVATLLALLTVGSIRRGPYLRFDPPDVGTGFGISGDMFASPRGNDDKPNVLDWEGCSMFSYITLFYNKDIAWKAFQGKDLRPSDVPYLEQRVRMDHVDPEALLHEASVEEQVQATRLLKAVYRPMKWIIVSCFGLELISLLAGYMQIAALYELIGTFGQDTQDHSYAYLACAGLFAGQLLQTALSAFVSSKESYQLCEPLRLRLSSTLYRKVLRMRNLNAVNPDQEDDPTAAKSQARAHILNIVTPDVFAVAVASKEAWYLLNAIISVTMALSFLYYLLGVSAFVGVAAIILASPASYWVAMATYSCQQVQNRTVDARVRATKEWLDSIKVVKLNAWEDHFVRRISQRRDVELLWQRWRYHLGTFFTILAEQVPLLSLVAILAFYTLVMGNPLEPATAFVVTNVYNKMRMAISDIPLHVQELLKAQISLGRIVTFLNDEEVQAMPTTSEQRVQVQSATIAWPSGTDDAFRLEGVNLDILPGLTLISGPLGSGKTLLLQAILGEVSVISGSVLAPRSTPEQVCANLDKWDGGAWLTDSMAYAPQVPYIRHGTIIDNVVFGLPFWEERYREVIRQCGLEPDLAALPDGDLTEIGEGGVNLSGGQKARINLARAVYSSARTVLLDDILSATDIHTAQHIVNECLKGGLLKDRIVILVTHQVSMCRSFAQSIVEVANGIVQQTSAESKPIREGRDEEQSQRGKTFTAPTAAVIAQAPAQASRKLYAQEQREVGSVRSSHYSMVFSAAGGYLYWASLFGIMLLCCGFKDSRQYVLRLWTEDDQADQDQLRHYISLYTALTVITSFFGAFRWFLLYGIGRVGMYNRGVRVIHGSLVQRLAGAPLRFFDITPKGRLLNVLTADVMRLDYWSADTLFRTINETMQVVVSLSLMCYFQPALVYVVLALVPPFYWTCGFVRRLRSEMRRLFAISTSPLASLWTDTIDGVFMARAFGLQHAYTQKLVAIKHQDMKMGSLSWFVYQWARIIINTFAALLLLVTGLVLVGGEWSSAEAGMILTFAMLVTGGLYQILEHSSRLDETMVSAERINQYIRLQDQEPTTGLDPSPGWPAKGRISMRDLEIRYSPDLPAVLHGINLDIQAEERVALVGATGSGKSTLAHSIFRSNVQMRGVIEIDGQDIDQLNLKELRSRLNMVVQESTLCSGTLRDALDISGEKDDIELYEALRHVHLLDDSNRDGVFGNLDSFVAPGGANFSMGQRQLLCLARAWLKRSKILVMDEATSSVDYETDAKVTATIQKSFEGVTMVLIAHRLTTVMHCDRVVVLDQGRVIEQGSPVKLLQDRSSRFHSMCSAQGDEEFKMLKALCRA